MNTKNLKNLCRLGMVAATFIWGTSFVVMKNVLDVVPPFALLAFRFLSGGLLLGLLFFRRMRRITVGDLWRGALAGCFVFIAYAFQTVGLQYTTPGKNAFLTATYCVIVPFIGWLVYRQRPDRYHAAAALLCLVGTALVSLTGDMSINIGDLLTLVCGFFFSLHIIALSRFSKGRDILAFTVLQFLTAGLCSLLVSCVVGETPVFPGAQDWAALLYLTLMATIVTYLLQNAAQKHLSASGVAVLLSLESVFGVLCSVLLYHERPAPRVYAGFVLIFAAVLLSEWERPARSTGANI
ncbi:MAG: DMT family transporter [Clostridia bacterium]|nr:DMT family transporter [Clostridia bacterium]